MPELDPPPHYLGAELPTVIAGPLAARPPTRTAMVFDDSGQLAETSPQNNARLTSTDVVGDFGRQKPRER
jgi:hypothetical protein